MTLMYSPDPRSSPSISRRAAGSSRQRPKDARGTPEAADMSSASDSLLGTMAAWQLEIATKILACLRSASAVSPSRVLLLCSSTKRGNSGYKMGRRESSSYVAMSEKSNLPLARALCSKGSWVLRCAGWASRLPMLFSSVMPSTCLSPLSPAPVGSGGEMDFVSPHSARSSTTAKMDASESRFLSYVTLHGTLHDASTPSRSSPAQNLVGSPAQTTRVTLGLALLELPAVALMPGASTLGSAIAAS
mmetsp:Transcript_37221/g.72622  ORF Transcript_37221/g.72622 Transcript_37221/m.72622 type:complete len:246 (-) Transcript_37221:610-1347(-)